MPSEDKVGLRDLIRDSSIILAVLTATAYVLGSLQIAQVSNYLGLNDLVTPDIDFKDVLMIGGVTEIIILSVVCALFFVFKHLFKIRADPRGELAALSRFAKLGLIYGLLLLIAVGLNFGLAILNGHLFKHQLHRVKTLELTSGEMPEASNLEFMGSMGNFTIFERIEGPGKGETVLIPEDDIKSLTISPESPP